MAQAAAASVAALEVLLQTAVQRAARGKEEEEEGRALAKAEEPLAAQAD